MATAFRASLLCHQLQHVPLSYHVSQIHALKKTIIKLLDECVRCTLVERQCLGEHDEPGPDPLFPVDGARVASMCLPLAMLALLRAGVGDPAHLQSLGGHEPS